MKVIFEIKSCIQILTTYIKIYAIDAVQHVIQ